MPIIASIFTAWSIKKALESPLVKYSLLGASALILHEVLKKRAIQDYYLISGINEEQAKNVNDTFITCFEHAFGESSGLLAYKENLEEKDIQVLPNDNFSGDEEKAFVKTFAKTVLLHPVSKQQWKISQYKPLSDNFLSPEKYIFNEHLKNIDELLESYLQIKKLNQAGQKLDVAGASVLSLNAALDLILNHLYIYATIPGSDAKKQIEQLFTRTDFFLTNLQTEFKKQSAGTIVWGNRRDVLIQNIKSMVEQYYHICLTRQKTLNIKAYCRYQTKLLGELANSFLTVIATLSDEKLNNQEIHVTKVANKILKYKYNGNHSVISETNILNIFVPLASILDACQREIIKNSSDLGNKEEKIFIRPSIGKNNYFRNSLSPLQILIQDKPEIFEQFFSDSQKIFIILSYLQILINELQYDSGNEGKILISSSEYYQFKFIIIYGFLNLLRSKISELFSSEIINQFNNFIETDNKNIKKFSQNEQIFKDFGIHSNIYHVVPNHQKIVVTKLIELSEKFNELIKEISNYSQKEFSSYKPKSYFKFMPYLALFIVQNELPLKYFFCLNEKNESLNALAALINSLEKIKTTLQKLKFKLIATDQEPNQSGRFLPTDNKTITPDGINNQIFTKFCKFFQKDFKYFKIHHKQINNKNPVTKSAKQTLSINFNFSEIKTLQDLKNWSLELISFCQELELFKSGINIEQFKKLFLSQDKYQEFINNCNSLLSISDIASNIISTHFNFEQQYQHNIDLVLHNIKNKYQTVSLQNKNLCNNMLNLESLNNELNLQNEHYAETVSQLKKSYDTISDKIETCQNSIQGFANKVLNKLTTIKKKYTQYHIHILEINKHLNELTSYSTAVDCKNSWENIANLTKLLGELSSSNDFIELIDDIIALTKNFEQENTAQFESIKKDFEDFKNKVIDLTNIIENQKKLIGVLENIIREKDTELDSKNKIISELTQNLDRIQKQCQKTVFPGMTNVEHYIVPLETTQSVIQNEVLKRNTPMPFWRNASPALTSIGVGGVIFLVCFLTAQPLPISITIAILMMVVTFLWRKERSKVKNYECKSSLYNRQNMTSAATPPSRVLPMLQV